MGKPLVTVLDKTVFTSQAPEGSHWDELPASTRRFEVDSFLTPLQLMGGGAPKPTPTANEEALIKEKMRTFPDQHPSLGSVKNLVATGCPGLVHSQMSSANWKSTFQATISNKEPTMPKRREGKRMAPALFGAGDLYTEPVEVYVAPSNAPPTIYRDQRVFKHMGTLTKAGHW